MIIAFCASGMYRQIPNEDEADLVSGKCREMSPITSNHCDYQNHTNIVDTTNDNNGYVLNNHNNCNKTTISSPECNQTPYGNAAEQYSHEQ